MKCLSLLLAWLAVAASQPSTKYNTECLGVGTNIDSVLSEPVQETSKSAINDGERAFAVNIIKNIFDEFKGHNINKNIFISPASIYQTMTLAFMGAKGQTEAELKETLGFGELNRTEIIKNYLFERAFEAIRETDPKLGYTLIHANKFFFDRGLDLNSCLQMVLQKELEAVDFSNTKKARKLINKWVEEKTKKTIRDLLPEGSIDDSTKVALVNAAYFKGEWMSKFEKNDTKFNNFYVKRDKISKTKFMEQKGKFNYYTSEELRAHVLEMPYVGDEVSMIVILPPFEEDSLFKTVDRLTPKTMKGVMDEVKSGFYTVDDLTVKLPRFRIEQSFELSDTLHGLGLSTLFDSSASDLRGFLAETSEARNDVKLSSAIHKSYIDVNEEGSEAAAATAVFGFRSARPLFHTEFVADHPFLFLIYDKPSDTVLFFGVFQDPKY